MYILNNYQKFFKLGINDTTNIILNICNLLKIDYYVVKENIFFGDDAIIEILKNTNLSKSQVKKVNGMFLYLDKSGQLLKNPIVCIVNINKGTLAHELCHYKQFLEKDKNLLSVNYILKNESYYKYIKNYPYYSCEKEAFGFALNYLSKEPFSKVRYLLYYINYNFLKFNYYLKKN